MSTVRFVCDSHPEHDLIEVEYGYAGHATPAVGTSVVADGSDPAFPAGIYEVTHVSSWVTLRGPLRDVVDLRWVYRLPDEIAAGHGR